jgi:hypothetical protein
LDLRTASEHSLERLVLRAALETGATDLGMRLRHAMQMNLVDYARTELRRVFAGNNAPVFAFSAALVSMLVHHDVVFFVRTGMSC